jgi:hypothetical protein
MRCRRGRDIQPAYLSSLDHRVLFRLQQSRSISRSADRYQYWHVTAFVGWAFRPRFAVAWAASLGLGLKCETIAEHVLRNFAIKQGSICVETHARTALRRSGLLADLQEARATILLIKRNDNHSDLLGEITREIKLSK